MSMGHGLRIVPLKSHTVYTHIMWSEDVGPDDEEEGEDEDQGTHCRTALITTPSFFA